jgi:hypothetical protein
VFNGWARGGGAAAGPAPAEGAAGAAAAGELLAAYRAARDPADVYHEEAAAVGGRLVLAGDDLQLPPIVAGEYPEPAPGRPPLHRSVFELVAAALSLPDPLARAEAARTTPFFKMLLDNWRMNDVLTSFAARFLYGPRYRPATPTVAGRRLPYEPPADAPAVVRACLDRTHPLVVVLVEGVHATSENETEAALVRDLALALREGLRDDESQLYTSDESFFEKGLFIVCPHRAQNRLVRRLLREARSWSGDPVADTVDKMQGQESDAVLASKSKRPTGAPGAVGSSGRPRTPSTPSPPAQRLAKVAEARTQPDTGRSTRQP